MLGSLTYRTADNTRWGGGNGSDLSATQIDLNFWALSQAVLAIQSDPNSFAGIDYFNQTAGNLLYIHLTDHRVLGPFTLPTAEWNPRGEWTAATAYAAFDVVYYDGAVYLITVPHTSGATFSPFSTDGNGHNLYNLILSQPADELPAGGEVGQRLVKATSSPFSTMWEYDNIRLCLYVEGQPTSGELLFQYIVVDHMTLPLGLSGSGFFAATPCASLTTYTLNLNGAAIGLINFTVSPEGVTVDFSTPVNLVPGDVLTLVAPPSPDAAQSNISFTLVAQLTQ